MKLSIRYVEEILRECVVKKTKTKAESTSVQKVRFIPLHDRFHLAQEEALRH